MELFPKIEQAVYTMDGRRVRLQISSVRSPLVSSDQWCIQYYHQSTAAIETHQDLPPCVPLNILQSTKNELEIPTVDEPLGPIRLKICFVNQTDICSKSTGMPVGVSLATDSSELILILIGRLSRNFP